VGLFDFAAEAVPSCEQQNGTVFHHAGRPSKKYTHLRRQAKGSRTTRNRPYTHTHYPVLKCSRVALKEKNFALASAPLPASVAALLSLGGCSGAAMPKGTGRIVIDPFTNGLLTTLFGLEVVAVFAVLLALPGALPAGCPLTGPQAFAALAVTCLALFPLIGLVKLIAGHACALLSRTALAHLGDPVAKVKTRNKLRDQSWQLTIHSAMTALEAYILFVDGGGEHWLDDYRSLWTPHPHQQAGCAPVVAPLATRARQPQTPRPRAQPDCARWPRSASRRQQQHHAPPPRQQLSHRTRLPSTRPTAAAHPSLPPSTRRPRQVNSKRSAISGNLG